MGKRKALAAVMLALALSVGNVLPVFAAGNLDTNKPSVEIATASGVGEEIIDLSGEWLFEMAAQESASTLNETVSLPGSMDENKKGVRNTATSPTYLNRDYLYAGPATYQKEILVAEDWSDKEVTLFLERTKKTRVWIDGQLVGDQQKSFITPHTYDVSDFIIPGKKQTLTIEVDNSRVGMPNSMFDTFVSGEPWNHQVTEHTQTNWNGIIGRMELQADDLVHIINVKVRPDVANKTARVTVVLEKEAGVGAVSGNIALQAQSWNNETATHTPEAQTVPMSMEASETAKEISFTYVMGDGVLLWDEFTPTLYKMTASLTAQDAEDTYSSAYEADFGMRKFKTVNKTQFAVNDKVVMLRGDVNCAVFPETGYSPASLEKWLEVMQTYKDYGFNHVRFHSWMPPKAAFDAADQLGLYVQAELPQWSHVMFPADSRDYFKNEAARVFNSYGNSPAFVMMTSGNELNPGNSYYDTFLRYCKTLEPEMLYSDIAGHCDRSAEDDFGGTYGSLLGGIQIGNNWDYNSQTAGFDRPYLAHEPGQLQVYPDYATELPKYEEKNSVLKPRNLEYFQSILEGMGIGDMADEFNKSSGALSAMMYRYICESQLRTKNNTGFQLLGLADFSGQGTALVGVLDAFMESKGLITPEEYRRSNAPVTVLARIPNFIMTNDKTLTATVEVANYGADEISNAIEWTLRYKDSGVQIDAGVIEAKSTPQGMSTVIGTLSAPLASVAEASKIELVLKMQNTELNNNYDLWVYPAEITVPETGEDILVVRSFNREAKQALDAGKNVLLISTGDKSSLPLSKNVGFYPDFWSPMFHSANNDGYTLGTYINEEHPMFAEFPTDNFASWQWYALVNGSRGLLINDAPVELKPIMQPIATIDQADRMASVFEANVSNGKLLASSINFLDPKTAPAKQLLTSTINYMNSDKFAPTATLDSKLLQKLLPSDELASVSVNFDSEISPVSAQADFQPAYPISNLIDGNTKNLWHTTYSPNETKYPHEIMMDMGKPIPINGVKYVPRQDQNSNPIGTITKYEVYAGTDKDNLEKVAEGSWTWTVDTKVAKFPETIAQYVEFVALESVNKNGYKSNNASGAEMSMITDLDEFVDVGETTAVILQGKNGRGQNAAIPSDAIITYSSEQPEIAQVDQNGLITGVSKGIAYINIDVEVDDVVYSGRTYVIVGVESTNIPQKNFKVSSVSAHRDYPLSNMTDGNKSTFWHNDWENSSLRLPENVILELDEPTQVGALVVTPRGDNPGGNMIKAEVYVSTDGEDYTQVGSAEYTVDQAGKDFSDKMFAFAPQTVKFVKLKIIEAIGTGNINTAASIAEINLYGGKAIKEVQPIEDISVRYGTKLSDIKNLPSDQVKITYFDGSEGTAFTQWDFAKYNPEVSGTYTFAQEIVTMDGLNLKNIKASLNIIVREKDMSMGDKLPLSVLMEKVNKLVSTDYTTESWANLTAAMNEANGVMIDTDAPQHDVDVSLDRLQKAIDDLVIIEAENSVQFVPIGEISGAKDTLFHVNASINSFPETGVKALQSIVAIPTGVTVADVNLIGMSGGTLDFHQDAQGKLRLSYLNVDTGAPIVFDKGTAARAPFLDITLQLSEDKAENSTFAVTMEQLLAINSDPAQTVAFSLAKATSQATVKNPVIITASAQELYTGDGEDLIETGKKAISVEFINMENKPMNVRFGEIQFYYSSERSAKTEKATYVAIVDASTAIEEFDVYDGYTVSETAPETILFGDVDGTAGINAQDALSVLSAWLRKSDAPDDKGILQMNVSADGAINTSDSIALIDFFINKTELTIVVK